MLTWGEFAAREPELAEAGRKHFYQWDIGPAFLATVRPDGGPRVHPVCPVIDDDSIHLLITAGPKQRDLMRDGRYALHGETCPPPRHDDGFSITGRARRVDDPDVKRRLGEQMRAERKMDQLWPSFDIDLPFELLIDGCLLMMTEADERFPQGPTVRRFP